MVWDSIKQTSSSDVDSGDLSDLQKRILDILKDGSRTGFEIRARVMKAESEVTHAIEDLEKRHLVSISPTTNNDVMVRLSAPRRK